MEATTSLPVGTITFLFTDIEGSTRLWDHHPGAMPQALARHDSLLRHTIEGRGGHVFKTMGDQFCAAFASASDALAAALEGQDALARQEWGEVGLLRVRMALHTGAAELREGDYFGPALNRVARILDVGNGGQTLLSQATFDLVQAVLPPGVHVQDLGRHRLRDLQEPERLFQLRHPDLPGVASSLPIRSLDVLPNNLPYQLTHFVGREWEMVEVRQLLSSTRLLTLTGAGGCGKTRLALQLAAEVVEEYADGVWLVELAALADPERVPQSVASVLSVKAETARPLTETLVDHLRTRSALLLLDNCEHLLTAAAGLVELLLRRCPDLRVLATSREGLGMAGELSYRVPSLSVPDPGSLPSGGASSAPEPTGQRQAGSPGSEQARVFPLTQYEAVRLFVDRAVFSQPHFTLNDDNAAAVVQICRRLDGMPLAIELAAARVKAFSVDQIAQRLGDRFRLLTGGSRTALPRQQTLRATMDWSYNLLSEPEQALLRCLSVFAGGWTLEAAEAVFDNDVLDLLPALVEKSLVIYTEQGREARYRPLETVRQYGRDRLLEAGEAAATRARHRDWYVALAERAEPELWGAGQAVWLDRLETEHDNLRAALDWSLETGEVEAGLRLAGAVWRFWHIRGYREEGRARLVRLLSHPEAAARTAIRARALDGAAVMASTSRDLEAGRALYEEELAIGRELGDKRIIASALNGLGEVALFSGDHAMARARYEESLENSREVGDKWNMAFSLVALGNAVRGQGDPERARSLYTESLALFRELGDRRGITMPLFNLARLAQDGDDYATARPHWEECLEIWRELHERGSIAWALGRLGQIARCEGDYETARAHYAESLAIAREAREPWHIAQSLYGLGHVAHDEGNSPTARSLCEESLAMLRQQGVLWAVAQVLNTLGDVARSQREEGTARAFYEEGLAIQRERGERSSKSDTAASLLGLGLLAQQRGDTVEAGALCRESLVLYHTVGTRRGIAQVLEGLAGVAVAVGDPRRAAQLFGAAVALRDGPRHEGAAGAPRPPVEQGDRERNLDAARAALGEDLFAAAWKEGHAMTLDQIVATALEPESDATKP